MSVHKSHVFSVKVVILTAFVLAGVVYGCPTTLDVGSNCNYTQDILYLIITSICNYQKKQQII